jgi:hypothetical protein
LTRFEHRTITFLSPQFLFSFSTFISSTSDSAFSFSKSFALMISSNLALLPLPSAEFAPFPPFPHRLDFRQKHIAGRGLDRIVSRGRRDFAQFFPFAIKQYELAERKNVIWRPQPD